MRRGGVVLNKLRRASRDSSVSISFCPPDFVEFPSFLPPDLFTLTGRMQIVCLF